MITLHTNPHIYDSLKDESEKSLAFLQQLCKDSPRAVLIRDHYYTSSFNGYVLIYIHKWNESAFTIFIRDRHCWGYGKNFESLEEAIKLFDSLWGRTISSLEFHTLDQASLTLLRTKYGFHPL